MHADLQHLGCSDTIEHHLSVARLFLLQYAQFGIFLLHPFFFILETIYLEAAFVYASCQTLI